MNATRKAQLQAQLDEILEQGAGQIGYYEAIFKDEGFDLYWTMTEIIPRLAQNGQFDLSKMNGNYDIPDMILDEYLREDWEKGEALDYFEPLSYYFFNKEKHIR